MRRGDPRDEATEEILWLEESLRMPSVAPGAVPERMGLWRQIRGFVIAFRTGGGPRKPRTELVRSPEMKSQIEHLRAQGYVPESFWQSEGEDEAATETRE